MNVVRSTVVWRGYLLTALAVAVLLAGFSGTAWAQAGTKVTARSSFRGSTGTLPEGADTENSTPAPLEVTIRRTTKTKNDPYNTPPNNTGGHLEIQFEYDGEKGLPPGITVYADYAPGAALTIGNEGTASLTFPSSDTTRLEKTTVPAVEDTTDRLVFERDVTIAETEIVLSFRDGRNDDDDWLREKFSMTLSKGDGLGPDDEYAEEDTDTQQKLQDALLNPFVNDFTSSKFTVNDRLTTTRSPYSNSTIPTSCWPRAAHRR